MDLGGLVARNSRVFPDKEGVIYGDNRYTWKEINEKVNASACLKRETRWRCG
jgi:fatty-acyl-CoA synthase